MSDSDLHPSELSWVKLPQRDGFEMVGHFCPPGSRIMFVHAADPEHLVDGKPICGHVPPKEV